MSVNIMRKLQVSFAGAEAVYAASKRGLRSNS